jgi:hypothetical protein
MEKSKSWNDFVIYWEWLFYIKHIFLSSQEATRKLAASAYPVTSMLGSLF